MVIFLRRSYDLQVALNCPPQIIPPQNIKVNLISLVFYTYKWYLFSKRIFLGNKVIILKIITEPDHN